MSSASALSEKRSPSRPAEVLERSLEKGRLGHGILLHGESLEVLAEAALTISRILLAAPSLENGHPDLFILRPTHKSRLIRIEETRRLIRTIQHTPHLANRKVAIIREADRMNKAASNAFLKTLEEPPPDTTLFLLSTRPHDLLDTIRSRCFHFRLPSACVPLAEADWKPWLSDYEKWLGELLAGPKTAPARADLVMSVYGLVTRFQTLLAAFAARAWEREKTELPAGTGEEEKEAAFTGMRKGIRQRMFSEIELATRDFAVHHSSQGDSIFQKLTRTVGNLEHAVGLLAVNLRENVALEYFLLTSLRTWTAR